MMRNERGLTLVEVLAALVLIGLAVTLFISLSGTVFLSGEVEDRRSAASELAENELNLWKAKLKSDAVLPVLPYIRQEGAFTITVLPPQALNASTDPATLYSGQLSGVPPTRISMQTVLYQDGQPTLLTVVVSWETEP